MAQLMKLPVKMKLIPIPSEVLYSLLVIFIETGWNIQNYLKTK